MSRSYRPAPALRVLAAAAACATAGLLATACSAASQNAASERRAAPAVPVPAPAGASGVQGASGSYAAGPRSSNASELTRLSPAQSIIYTANLTIQVKDVTATAAKASKDVTAVGGYIASEQRAVPGGKHGVAQVSLELKIPVTAYQTTLTELSTLGKPLAFSTEAQDVTQQVADVSSRVASFQAAIKQLRALLSRAGNVSQLLSVQEEINSQQSDLESLLAQQQALDHETSYGTVTLQVTGHRARPVRKKRTSHGLAAGLGTGWRALKAVVVWLLTALGVVLPFAVPIAVLGGIIYVGRRRVVRRRRSQPAGTA
jgi:hypothetical protein